MNQQKKRLDFRNLKPILGIIITSFGFLVAIVAMTSISLNNFYLIKPLNPNLFEQFLTKLFLSQTSNPYFKFLGWILLLLFSSTFEPRNHTT